MSVNTQNLKMEINDLRKIAGSTQISKLNHLLDSILNDNSRAAGVVSRLRKLFLHGNTQFSRINISEILSEVLDLIKVEIAKNQIVIASNIEPNISLFGDSGQIQMVFLNAINNAIDALRNFEGPRKINLSLNQKDDRIIFKVSDSGPGFAPSILDSAFELFKTTKVDGMGVGLWLSRAIMENHNGSISIENSADGGAVLTLNFYLSKKS
jgi:C4-dicarboxylate-specific signal transduction histidine kinase